MKQRKRRRNRKRIDFIQNLPDDLVLNHVFQRLDFSSRVRVGVVCQLWRHLISSLIFSSPLPWLCANNSTGRGVITVASPCILVANVHDSMLDVVGSHGHYVIANRKAISGDITALIFNPFTGESYPLPQTVACKKITLPERRYELVVIGLMKLPLLMARISSPPTSTECVAAAIDGDGRLCVCRLGVNAHWVFSAFHYARRNKTDLLFHEGNLWCISHQFRFTSLKVQHLFDLDSGFQFHALGADQELFNPTFMDNHDEDIEYITDVVRYIISSCRDLLVVTIYDRESASDPGRKTCYKFNVNKIEEEKQKLSLVPVDDLGDRMLFVGRSCSMSLSEKDFDGSVYGDGFFTRNCVYYVTWCDCLSCNCVEGSRHCARDVVRAHQLWKLRLSDHQVVGPVRLSSMGSPVWMTTPMSMYQTTQTRHT